MHYSTFVQLLLKEIISIPPISLGHSPAPHNKFTIYWLVSEESDRRSYVLKYCISEKLELRKVYKLAFQQGKDICGVTHCICWEAAGNWLKSTQHSASASVSVPLLLQIFKRWERDLGNDIEEAKDFFSERWGKRMQIRRKPGCTDVSAQKAEIHLAQFYNNV